MSFGDSVKTVLMEKYADFTGRARRSEYWWYYLATVILGWALNLAFLPRDYVQQVQDGTYEYGVGFMIICLVGLALLIPGLAVAVRRLHDTGKSGWYLFILLIPIVGVILLIVWLATESNNGSNAYGPDPRV